MYLHQKMHTYIIIEAAYGSHVVGMPVSIQRNYGFLYSGIPVSIFQNRGVKSPGILNNGDFIISATMPIDEWLIGYLLSFGSKVCIIEPKYLKKIVYNEAKKICEQNKP